MSAVLLHSMTLFLQVSRDYQVEAMNYMRTVGDERAMSHALRYH